MTALPPKPHNFYPLRFSPPSVSAAERRAMIELAAYHRAERRNFAAGHDVEDWNAAELEVEKQLSQALHVPGMLTW